LDQWEEWAGLVEQPLDRPVDRRSCGGPRGHHRLCGELLDRPVGALRPAGAEADELTRGEDEIVSGVGVVGAPEREPERRLPRPVVVEKVRGGRAGELDVDADLLEARL